MSRLRGPASRLPSPFRVLALESSADDTCASVVSSDRRILSNVVLKQHNLNEKYGGIMPLKSQDAHVAAMPLAIRQALDEAKLKIGEIDLFAYTRGPGMYGCLTTCVNSARAMAAALDKPVMGMHHMQAHAMTPFLTEETPPEFPFLTLLVSGGHTMLLLATAVNEFKILANKVDNAVGVAFDKTARLLQIPPLPDRGLGAALEAYAVPSALADKEYDTLPKFTRPMPGKLAFSYAGLMSSVERETQKRIPNLKRDFSSTYTGSEPLRRAIARRFQEAAIDHLTDKVGLALDSLEGAESTKGPQGDQRVKGLVISGGVASNQHLRQQMAACLLKRAPSNSLRLMYPPISLCTDNAAMIAWAAIQRFQAEGEAAFDNNRDMPIMNKWSLEQLS